MIRNIRDNIYVAVVRCEGFQRGYLIVHDSNLDVYRRAFWPGTYNFCEAFVDVVLRCRKIADKMGYRKPDEAQT